MIGDEKIVNFEFYCEKCLFFDNAEYEDPCHECLSTPTNQDSRKPVKFRWKEKKND